MPIEFVKNQETDIPSLFMAFLGPKSTLQKKLAEKMQIALKLDILLFALPDPNSRFLQKEPCLKLVIAISYFTISIARSE